MIIIKKDKIEIYINNCIIWCIYIRKYWLYEGCDMCCISIYCIIYKEGLIVYNI